MDNSNPQNNQNTDGENTPSVLPVIQIKDTIIQMLNRAIRSEVAATPMERELRSSFNRLGAVYGQKRAADMIAVISATLDIIERERANLLPDNENKNRWRYVGFVPSTHIDFAIATIRNAEIYRVHFLEDYFESQDRLQLIRKTGADNFAGITSHQSEFGTWLARLFYQRDLMEGGKVAGPITKQMLRQGEKPWVLYSTVKTDDAFVKMDQFRQPDVTKTIDELCKHFKEAKRAYWRELFLHIADGGDANARQIHAGPKLTNAEINGTLVALNGRSQAQAAIHLDMSERGLKKRLKIMKTMGIKIPKNKG